jgi:predicted NBD/HSP70 family sugar kinase
MKLMIFDVGGTEIKYSVMDDRLNRTDAGSVPTPMTNQEDFLDTLAAIYEPHRAEVEGIAVSLPGFVDAESGVVKGGGVLLYNIGTPVGPRLAARCGCPVRLENDGKAAAMAELQAGALQGCRNASVFIIGTGVGGGLIIDGKLVRGRDCTAGEFSFLNTNSTAWENENSALALTCSTTALLRAYRAAAQLPETEKPDGRAFFAKVNEGDETARAVLKAFCKQVAIQIYNLTMLLDIEKVAIGGGISKQPILVETLRAVYDELMATHAFGTASASILPRTEIVPCRFSSEANQVGALYAYMQAGLGR